MSSTPWVCSPLPGLLPKEPSRVKPLGKVTLPCNQGKEAGMPVCLSILSHKRLGPGGWPSHHPFNLPHP